MNYLEGMHEIEALLKDIEQGGNPEDMQKNIDEGLRLLDTMRSLLRMDEGKISVARREKDSLAYTPFK